MIPSDLDPDMEDGENDNLLESIDIAMAEHVLERLKSGEATPAELAEARKYLTYKGYRGPSPDAVKKTGAQDPRADLSSIPDTVLELFDS